MISILSLLLGCAIGYGIARLQTWLENLGKRSKQRSQQDDNAKMRWSHHG